MSPSPTAGNYSQRRRDERQEICLQPSHQPTVRGSHLADQLPTGQSLSLSRRLPPPQVSDKPWSSPEFGLYLQITQ